MEFPIIATRYDHVNTFVNAIAPLVVNEWLRRRKAGEKTISPAVVIAQGGKESGWNLNASTIFGIKGRGIELDTTEYINGEYVHIKDSFATYPNLAGAVQGYYTLVQWENYDDATSANTVEDELEGLTNNIGYAYATAPDYKKTTLDIINDFGLRVFNDYAKSLLEEKGPFENVSDEELADRVMRGVFGDGEARRNALGSRWDAVQAIVDSRCKPKDEPKETFNLKRIEKGDTVRVVNAIDYSGNRLCLWHDAYTVIELIGDRAVIGVNGVVTAAINVNNLKLA